MSAYSETLKEIVEKLEQADLSEKKTFLVADFEGYYAALTIPDGLAEVLAETAKLKGGWIPDLQGRNDVKAEVFMGNVDGMSVRGGDPDLPSIVDVTGVDLSRPFEADGVRSGGLKECDVYLLLSFTGGSVCVNAEDSEEFHQGSYFEFATSTMIDGTAPKASNKEAPCPR